MAITRRITTSTEEPLYNEGDVLAKSANGLPMYGMTEADMQALQAAPAAQVAQAAQAQRTAEIVNAARNGQTVTYGGGQTGGVTILPDIRGDGDGVWLANMAPGRPIDLGPTAGWAGFNGQGQFVGYPSGMPHVLYGGFMDTLAPFMQYFAPMHQQARAAAAQAAATPAAPASPRRRTDTTDTTDTTAEEVTTGSAPVSRDLTNNAWSIRTPATTWLEEAKRNIAGVDENGNPILDLESIQPTQDLLMTGPRGNVIRFTPETTQERQIQQYSAPILDPSILDTTTLPTAEIPDYVEPAVSDMDWSTIIGTGGTAGFTGEIPDVSPEVAQNAMNQLSLFAMLLPGLGWGNAVRAAGAAGASTLARRLGLGGGKPNVRVKPQTSTSVDPYKAPEQLRAPTVVRAEGARFQGQPSTPYTPYVAPQPVQQATSLSDWMAPFATQRSMWGMYNNPMAGAPVVSPQVLARSRALASSSNNRFVGPPAPPLPSLGVDLAGPTLSGRPIPQAIIRPRGESLVNNFIGPRVPLGLNRRSPETFIGPPKPFIGPRPRPQVQLVRPESIDRVITQPVRPQQPPLNAPDEFGRYAPIIRPTQPKAPTAAKQTTKPAAKKPSTTKKPVEKKPTTRKKKAD